MQQFRWCLAGLPSCGEHRLNNFSSCPHPLLACKPSENARGWVGVTWLGNSFTPHMYGGEGVKDQEKREERDRAREKSTERRWSRPQPRLSCHIGFTPWIVIRPCPNYPNLEAFWLLRTLPSSKVPRTYSVHIAHCLIPLTPYQERGQLYKLKAKNSFLSYTAPLAPGAGTTVDPPWTLEANTLLYKPYRERKGKKEKQ